MMDEQINVLIGPKLILKHENTVNIHPFITVGTKSPGTDNLLS